jgi:hypothetical protein
MMVSFIIVYNNSPVSVKIILDVKSSVFSNKKTAGHLHAKPFFFYAVSDPTSQPELPELQGQPELPQEPERGSLQARGPRSQQVFAPLPSCSQRLQKIMSRRKAGKE